MCDDKHITSMSYAITHFEHGSGRSFEASFLVLEWNREYLFEDFDITCS